MEPMIRERRLPPPELGPMLAAARMRAGLRGREAARLLGLSQSYLVRLESGQRVPSMTVAGRLAERLGLSEDERAALLTAAVDDAGADHPARTTAATHPR
ncbi:helix-turn-helix domain-containing protein [Streptacidiphilus carbonis]|uniref:helix-turn-helix domain-containing protein n=1 Tax=Streptacidiphilus carbonis TaxID=105422 RepID=UPI0005AA5289|nr:helix-turn-helix transcriptional regulator [Streptacidiphilus carbonis]